MKPNGEPRRLAPATPGRTGRTAILAGFAAAVGATVLTMTVEFSRLFPDAPSTWPEFGLLLVFPVLALWISANFWIAVFGAAGLTLDRLRARLLRKPRVRPVSGRPVGVRLVVVMPIHEEDPQAVFRGLDAVMVSLQSVPRLAGFHLFILSDTRAEATAAAEEDVCRALRARHDAADRVFYRRRSGNAGRKAGNVQDFVERWGGRYDYMLVLDADSRMDGDTVLRMVDALEADPRLGLIQSWTRPIGAGTAFGRMQQFAASSYGQPVAEGLRLLMGNAAPFWGHNAVIRVAAFAGSCGLPRLPGRPPLGGEILSHDFVEAALLAANGWSVRILPDRLASFEEPPPGLLSSAVRDRRWCQGNLQHLQLIAAAGLKTASRLHFLMGGMAYLSSPLWLLFLVLGFCQLTVGDGAPVAPVDAEPWILIGGPLFLLLAPKALGSLLVLADRDLRRGHGGIAGQLTSLVTEVLVSALLAPVIMLVHTRFVLAVLRGRSSGWNPQCRVGTAEGIARHAAAHAGHTAAGAVAAVSAWILSPEALVWLLPVVLGPLLSIPLSWLSGDPGFGRSVMRSGLFRVPEETDPAPLVADMVPTAPGGRSVGRYRGLQAGSWANGGRR